MKLIVVILFLVSFITLGCSHSEKVAHKSESRKEWTLSAKIVQPLLDKDLLDFRKIQRSSPVLVKDVLVQANAIDGIQAFRITQSGLKRLWKTPILNGIEASIVQINNLLFFGASDGYFYSLKLENGEVNWKVPVKSEVLSQALLDDEGRLFFLAGNNVLYALDAADGHQLWVYSRQDTANMTIRGGGRPAVRDGILYLGFSDGSLVALSAKSGAPQWEIQLNKNKKFKDIDSSPVVDGEKLYVSGYDDKLYCISRKDGEILWKYEAGGFDSIVIDSDRIYYPTTNGELLAIDKLSGKLIWKYNQFLGIPTKVKLIHNRFLVVGDSLGKLNILLKNGSFFASFEPGRGVFSAPEFDSSNDMIYFISNESYLYGLEFKQLYPKWIPYVL